MGSQSAIYGLKCQGRCVSALEGDKSRHRFLVGTCSSREENELHLVSFNDERDDVECDAVYAHRNEIWQIVPHNTRADLALTIHRNGRTQGATMWKLAAHDGAADTATTDDNTDELKSAKHDGTERAVPLVAAWTLPDLSKSIRSVALSAVDADAAGITAIDDAALRLFKLNDNGESVVAVASVPMTDASAVCWDPHHTALVAVAHGRSLSCFDTRALSGANANGHSGLASCHDDAVSDIDYNPNKPYQIMTAARDRRVHIWDIRRTGGAPLRILFTESHWIWQSRFNRFHDQLILSAGTEQIALWSIVSTSSAPLGDNDDGAAVEARTSDKLIKVYSDHEDSVYSACWSAADAWVFASISYDGRLVVNQVPPAEKYKILL